MVCITATAGKKLPKRVRLARRSGVPMLLCRLAGDFLPSINLDSYG